MMWRNLLKFIMNPTSIYIRFSLWWQRTTQESRYSIELPLAKKNLAPINNSQCRYIVFQGSLGDWTSWNHVDVISGLWCQRTDRSPCSPCRDHYTVTSCGRVRHYNMTVWILARNDITFSMAAGLIRLHMPGVKCVTKASACHHTLHANHWHCLWKFPRIVAVKSNVTTFIQVLRFVVNMFYYGRVAFTVFKHADIKGVRQRLTNTASLDDGYSEATIPVVKRHHVT